MTTRKKCLFSDIVIGMLDHARQHHKHRAGLRRRLRPNRAPQTDVILPKKSMWLKIDRKSQKNSQRKAIKLPGIKPQTEKVNLILARSPRKTKVGLLIGAGVGFLATLAIINWVSPVIIANWGLPNLYAPLLISFGLIWFCLVRLVFVSPLALAIAFGPVALLSLKLHQVVMTSQLVAVVIALVVLFVLVSIIVRQILIWAFD